jgi:integrase
LQAPDTYGVGGILTDWFQHHFNMVNCSAKIVFNPQRVRQDGTVLLYLRVIIGGRKKDIDLKLYWPLDRFDKKNRRCLPLSKTDKHYSDNNIMLADAEARSTEIFVQYRLRRMALSLEIFLKEYHSKISRDSFIKYFENKILQRYREGEIADLTKASHLGTVNHLKNWKKELLFADLDDRTAIQFDKYLSSKKTDCNTINARWAHHKNFRTYLNQAKKKDKIEFVHPYDYFSPKTEMGRFQPLTKDEFLSMWEYYQEPLIHPTHRMVLRSFLFVCVTGMRHGDVRRVDLDWIDGEFFDFVPYKTRRFGTRVRMPITAEAINLMADEIDEVGRYPLFCSITEQKQNEIIDEIADLLDIKMKVCFQIGRETFATLYMEHDGKLEVLASFMGHTTTKMSEKYVKIRDLRKKQESMRISEFVKRT